MVGREAIMGDGGRVEGVGNGSGGREVLRRVGGYAWEASCWCS